jgi:hypothetical protein
MFYNMWDAGSGKIFLYVGRRLSGQPTQLFQIFNIPNLPGLIYNANKLKY